MNSMHHTGERTNSNGGRNPMYRHFNANNIIIFYQNHTSELTNSNDRRNPVYHNFNANNIINFHHEQYASHR